MKSFIKNKKTMLLVYTYFFAILSFTSCSEDDITPPPPDVDPIIEHAIEKLPIDELLDIVQETTFNYFWDFAEPTSGLARERSQDDTYEGQSSRVIAMGASGFGISCYPVAVTRGWITKDEAIHWKFEGDGRDEWEKKMDKSLAETKIPNAETIETIRKIEAGEDIRSVDSVDELIKEMES